MVVDILDQMLQQEGNPHSTQKGLQYAYDCCFCDDRRRRLFINVDKQVFWCHNCNSTGSLITFFSEYNHVSWAEALKMYRGYVGYEKQLPDSLEDEIYSRLMGNLEVPQEKHTFDLPEEFILIEHATGKAGQKAVKYLRSRGVTLEMCEKYYIGYCAEGHYANRIIMPDFEGGDLIYWQARTFEPTPKNPVLKKLFRKVLNPSLDEEQIARGVRAVEKSEVISNIDLILQERMAIVCEGKMDSYTIGDMGACIHGKHMSDTQFMKLVTNKDAIDVIAVMLDGDALEQAISTADRLYRHFDDVLVCRLPRDADPNSLGRRKVLDILQNDMIPYSPMFKVKARLKGWI